MDGDHAELTDFGLMKDVKAVTPLTVAGTFIGTCDYAAPEQLLALDVDARADVYGLGCVLYRGADRRGAVPARQPGGDDVRARRLTAAHAGPRRSGR